MARLGVRAKFEHAAGDDEAAQRVHRAERGERRDETCGVGVVGVVDQRHAGSAVNREAALGAGVSAHRQSGVFKRHTRRDRRADGGQRVGNLMHAGNAEQAGGARAAGFIGNDKTRAAFVVESDLGRGETRALAQTERDDAAARTHQISKCMSSAFSSGVVELLEFQDRTFCARRFNCFSFE
jgi:hypothetical protein